MSQGKKILVVGSMNMDLVATMERFPEANETIIGEDYHFIAGGKGGNQAVAAARLGADVWIYSSVGQDEQGVSLCQGMEAEGISTEHIQVSEDAPTGLALIPVDVHGNNQIIVMPGANKTLDASQLESVFDAVQPDAVILQLEIPLDVIKETIRLSAERKILSVLDAGPALDVPLETFAGIRLISPNESECQTWTGITPTDLESSTRASDILFEKTGADYVVLKMGKLGAYYNDGSSAALIPPTLHKAIDSTAAGDCFTAALTLRFLETGEWEESVFFANVAAGIAVSRMGAQPSLPQRAEVDQYIEDTYS